VLQALYMYFEYYHSVCVKYYNKCICFASIDWFIFFLHKCVRWFSTC